MPSRPADKDLEMLSSETLDDRRFIQESDVPLGGGGIDTFARSAVVIDVSMTEWLFLLGDVDGAEKVTGDGLARPFEPSVLPVQTIINDLWQDL